MKVASIKKRYARRMAEVVRGVGGYLNAFSAHLKSS